MPLAVLEAVAAGCPVVVTAIPAHLELDLAPGQYFPVGDVDQLTERLVEVMRRARPELTAVQGTRICDPRFDWTHIAQQTARVLLDTPPDELGDPAPSPMRERSHGDAAVRE
jgi:glycosyltransferase involved in cell wall biosynthesis